MIFDDKYSQLSRFDTVERKGTPEPLDPEDEDDGITSGADTSSDESGSEESSSDDPVGGFSSLFGDRRSEDYGNPDGDYVIESDLVVPKIETIENEKPLIVVVDDDFETLDILEIYLKRDYECVTFSGPREAIFYLNQRVPDLILLDCKIHTMKATTFAEIIRSGAGKQKVPFVYMGSEEEISSIDSESIPEYIVGCLKRPVARGDLQGILDRTLRKRA